MKLIVPGVLACVIIAGCCANTQILNDLRFGMTRLDVVGIMGEPLSVSASEPVEDLIYILRETPTSRRHYYIVRLVNGTVAAYGLTKDFAQGPEKTVIDLNIKQQQQQVPPSPSILP